MSGCGGAPSFDGGGSGSSSSRAIVDVLDFRNQTAGALADGLHSWTTEGGITLPFTSALAAAAATWDIDATGLRFIASAANTSFTSAAQTASHFYALMSDIYAAFGIDATWTQYIRAYASVVTLPAAQAAPGGGWQLGVWGLAGSPSNSSDRLRSIVRCNSAGVQNVHSLSDASGGNAYTTAPVATTNVIGIVNRDAIQPVGGAWGGDFDSTSMLIESGLMISTATAPGAYRSTPSRLVQAFGSGNAGASMAITVQQIEFRYMPAVA